MEVTEEPLKPPSKSKILSAINTLSLHSVFVDQDCVEKITKHTRQLSSYSLFVKNFLHGHFQQSLRPTSLNLQLMLTR